MFAEFFEKISNYANHHQAIFASLIAISIICFTWGVEKILETYLFPSKPLYGYFAAIIASLAVLWFIHHFVLHVI
jgi:hypothetical protein